MQRTLAVGTLLGLIVSGCTEPVSPPVPSESDRGPAFSSVPIDRSASPMDIAVIGDVPYGAQALAQFPELIDAISADPKVRLAVHIGDIKSGSDLCSNAWFEEIARQFERFRDPLVYTIGDNEWTDCHRANNGGFNPLDRLAKLRETFFAVPGATLGGRNKQVLAQEDYPENTLWVESRVTFSAYHIVGSNNGVAPWFGGAETPAQTAARMAEYNARNEANIAWLERAFAVATEERSAGIVLFFQADLFNPFDRAIGVSFSGHQQFVERLADLAAEFDGPILLVSGDSHDWRVDVGVPWFSLYGVEPLANVTQIVVDRSLEEDANWVRIHVDPRSSEVFSWEEVFLP